MTVLYATDALHSVMLSHNYILDQDTKRAPQKRCPSKIFYRLLDKEYSYRTDKNKNSATEAEIGSLTACVPLDVGLAEQIDPHKRNT